eukprot:TRINITY_DN15593_c0_g1_i1.p2 TRINITY_DN15593_c0_g1~~TRINITY_DN15593_c0_g1_i1.p2  ORF type:complete len:119 (-),score=33.54 TRINITY_DN15593_c0_g1_i1:521-877(-)
MDISNVYPDPVGSHEDAEVVELQEELSRFHALDDDITEIRERSECESDELGERTVGTNAMEEEEVEEEVDFDDDPVSISFRAVCAKRDSLSEEDTNPESYKCNCDVHCLKEIPRTNVN